METLFILLILLGFTSSYAQTTKSINLDDTNFEIVDEEDLNTLNYNVSFTKNESKYIQVTAIPQNSKNAYIYMSKYSEEAPYSYSNKNDINTIWIPIDILNQNSFSLTVQCPDKCNFTLNFSSETAILLQKGETLSFLATDAFRKVEAIIKRDKDSNDIMNIFSIGTTDIDALLSVSYITKDNTTTIPGKPSALYNGDIAFFKEESYPYIEDSYYKIEVLITANILFTIGAEIIQEVNEIIPDSPAIYRFIQGNSNQVIHICYDIIKEKDFDNNAIYGIDILTRTGNIEVIYVNSTDVDIIKNTNGTIITRQDQLLINDYDRNNTPLFCLKPSMGTGIAYTLQVNSVTHYNTTLNNIEPMINGLIYNKWLLYNKIQYYRHSKILGNKTLRTKYNVKSLYGSISTYIHKCTTYPECYYTKETLEQLNENNELYKLIDNAGIASFSIEGDKETSLNDKSQYLLIVLCENYNGCKFQVFFFDENDKLFLLPDFRYSQLISKEEIEYYKIYSLGKENKILRVYLTTFTGDAKMIIKKEFDHVETKNYYYPGNTQIVEFVKSEGNYTSDVNGFYDIDIISINGAYYGIVYEVIDSYDSNIKPFYFELGYSFIQIIKDNETKIYSMQIADKDKNSNFCAMFYPLNCIIKVKFNNEVINYNKFNFIQHEITYQSAYYSNVTYTVSFEKMEHNAQYDGELCVFYMGAQELYENKEIILNEGIKYPMQLDKNIQSIRFVYPHSQRDGKVTAYFNMETSSILKINVLIDLHQVFELELKRSRFITISDQTIKTYCLDLELCNIIFDITYKNEIELDKGIVFKILVKSQGKVPSYLKKEEHYDDTVYLNSIQYYYTDITKDEEGEIVVNFNRGGGKMIGRIVRKDIIESNSDWNNKIKLPKEDMDDLLTSYDHFSKKLTYTSKDTEKCVLGCDLLIAVIAEDKYDDSKDYITEYSIYLRTISSDYYNGNLISIPINKYISGFASNDHMDYFTFVNIDNEVNEVYIEFQSEVCDMYINLSKDKPTQSKYDNIITPIKNKQIFKVKKAEIITIGLSINNINSSYSPFYSFRVLSYKENINTIMQINSDRNTLCSISNKEKKCYLFLPLDAYNGTFDDILIYSFSDELNNISIYANIAETSDLDKEESPINLFPTEENYSYSNHSNFLIINKGDINSNSTSILLTIISDKSVMINIVSTFRQNLQSTSLNPLREQIYTLDLSSKIEFTIPKELNYILHISSIQGEGNIQYKGNIYELKGQNESYELFNINDNLIVESSSDSNFTFILSNDLIAKKNILKVKPNINQKISYLNPQFPINFFGAIESFKNDSIFTIKLNTIDVNTNEDVHLFSIECYIIEEEEIEKIAKDASYIPKHLISIEGKYNTTTREGFIFIERENLLVYNNPYYYIQIGKGKNIKSEYTKIEGEVSFIYSQIKERDAPANTFFTGNLKKNQIEPIIFKLTKQEETHNKIQITFSPNSIGLINYAYLSSLESNITFYNINTQLEYTNSTDLNLTKAEYSNGKSTLQFSLNENQNEIYFSIFSNENDHKVYNPELSYYILKYSTTGKENFETYIIDNNSIIVNSTYINNPNIININVKTVKHEQRDIKGNYTIKIFDKEKIKDNIKVDTIAPVKVDAFKTIVKDNVVNDFNETIENFPSNKTFVFTVIVDLEEEKFAYNQIEFAIKANEQEEEEEDGSGASFPIVAVSIASIVVIILIVAIIYLYIRMRKRANSQSKHYSFHHNKLLPEEEETIL